MTQAAPRSETGPDGAKDRRFVGALLLALLAWCMVSCRASPLPPPPVDGPSTLRYLAGSWTLLRSGAGDGRHEACTHMVYQLSPSSLRLLEERNADWKYSGVILWNPRSCVFVRYALYETAMPGFVNAGAWTGTLDVPSGRILWRGTNGQPTVVWQLRSPDTIEIFEPGPSDPWSTSKGRLVAQYVRGAAPGAERPQPIAALSRQSAFREAIRSGRSFADLCVDYGDLMESYTNAEGFVVSQVLLGMDPEEPTVAATHTVGYSLVVSNGVIIICSPIVWHVGAPALRPRERPEHGDP